MERFRNVGTRKLDNDLLSLARLVGAVAVLFEEREPLRGFVGGVFEREVGERVEDRVRLVRREVGLVVDLGEDELVEGGGLDVDVDERAV